MKNSFLKKVLKNRDKIIPYFRNKIEPISALKPNESEATFSDIFIWRFNKNWNTFYDLIPYIDLLETKPYLINQGNKKSRLLIFSKKGTIISEINLEFQGLMKLEVNISDYIPTPYSNEEYGTFMFFHKDIPGKNILGKGNLTDRGYVSYSFNKSINHSYAHGNLDAVSSKFSSNRKKSFTYTKSTILKREFNIQYIFKTSYDYELAISNPTRRNQLIYFDFLKQNGDNLQTIKKEITSLGVEILMMPKFSSNYFVKIRSRIPMARPLIFKLKDQKFVDVFHS